jgi:hypothetical protein
VRRVFRSKEIKGDYSGHQKNVIRMDRICGTYGGETHLQGFGREICGEEVTWKARE